MMNFLEREAKRLKEQFGADPMKISWGNKNRSEDQRVPNEWQKNKPEFAYSGSVDPLSFSLTINTDPINNFSINGIHNLMIEDKIQVQNEELDEFLKNFDPDLSQLAFETWKEKILSGKRDQYEEEMRGFIRELERPVQYQKEEVQGDNLNPTAEQKKQEKKYSSNKTKLPNFHDKEMKKRMKELYEKKKALSEELMNQGKSFSQIDNETARNIFPWLKQKGYSTAISRDAYIFWSQMIINSYNGSGSENTDPCLIGWCWLSQEQIVEMTGINKNNLSRVKEALVKEGLLIIEKRLFKGAPKDYYLPMPKIDQS